MVAGYDSWLLKQADEYMRGCEPEMDRDGEYTKCIECFDKCEQYYEIFGKCADYMVDMWFCMGCPVKSCVYYEKHNKRDRVLNPDIKEFFDNCCRMERLK